MNKRVREIRRTSFLLAVALLCAFALSSLAGLHVSTPVAAAPIDNPFQETEAETTEPAGTGNNQSLPATPVPDPSSAPIPAEAGESAAQDTHEMTGETLPDWKLIPYNDPELMARDLTGSLSHGAVEASEQNTKIIPYSGGEMALRYAYSASGIGRSQGFLLFVDGVPQPYAIDRDEPLPGDDEYRYLHTVDVEEGRSKAEFTMRFTPVTGQEGDLLDLCIGAVLHAGFVPKNPRQFAFAPYYRFFSSNYVLDFHATPESIIASETNQPDAPNRILTEVDVLQEDMSSEELAFATSKTGADEFTETHSEFWLNGMDVRGEPHINLDQFDHLDFTFKLRGAPGRRWHIILYLDHAPLVLEEKNYFVLDVIRGQKNTFNFSLDPTLLDGVHTFYLLAMPVKEINAQGQWMDVNREIQTNPLTIYRAGEWRDWEPESP